MDEFTHQLFNQKSHSETTMTNDFVQAKLSKKAPYKLLALDGGGIRGVLSLEILAEIEQMLGDALRQSGQLNQDDSFVLGDYFDYIAGTSTGAIIATGLALGWSVKNLQDLYGTYGGEMFQKLPWSKLIRKLTKYDSLPLEKILKRKFGPRTTIGDKDLRTLLLLVMRNATTDSPWLLTNNPKAKYNDLARSDCNLNLPLWQLVRASTAAPIFFPPEEVAIAADKTFKFVDGGMTSFNSPGFQLYLMATSAPFNVNWETTNEQDMLLVSIGTGLTPGIETGKAKKGKKNFLNRLNFISNILTQVRKLLGIVSGMPLGLMSAAQYQQDLLCRLYGKCLAGDELDNEVGDLLKEKVKGPAARKLFTYLRYDALLTKEGLERLGLNNIDPATVQGLDSIESMPQLRKIGQTVAKQKVMLEHFKGFI
jgi:hypothetical protein